MSLSTRIPSFLALVVALSTAHTAFAEDSPTAAYQAHLAAFNAGDADAYFGHYDDTFCFHNKETTVDGLRKNIGKLFAPGAPRTPINMSFHEVLEHNPEGALLWSVNTQGESAHVRLIVLKRDGARWRLLVETSPERLKCVPELLDHAEPAQRQAIKGVSKMIELGKKLGKKEISVDVLSDQIPPCPAGSESNSDGWSDHEYDEEGGIEDYNRVELFECRDGDDNPVGPAIEVQDIGGGGTVTFSYSYKGQDALGFSVDY